ncbi:MAG TPA: DUF2007 domain-containing protein [Rhodanobacteraceae bacterium]|nr:DUF2007 domain-containing protein [Rhodanobacteraceae bacterium]
MQIVYRAENIIDAHLVKNALAREGIPAYVSGEYLTGGVGQLPASDYVAVMVSGIDIERAQAIAHDVDVALRTAPETGTVVEPDAPLAPSHA